MAQVASNEEVAAALRELARYRDLEGRGFSADAYTRGARFVAQLDNPVSQYSIDELCAASGIGEKLATSMHTLAEGVVPEALREAREKLPPSVFTMTRVVGIGAKTAVRIFREHGCASFESLLEAAEAGHLPEKLARRVLASEHMSPRVSWATAHQIVREITTALSNGFKYRLQSAGSYRRRRDTVGDIDILFTTRFPIRVRWVRDRFLGLGQVVVAGETKLSILYAVPGNGKLIRVDLLIVDPKAWGAALLYFTGSAEHNIALRKQAISRDMVLNEYGLWQGSERLSSHSEREIYALLGLAWHPPHRRTDKLRLKGTATKCRSGSNILPISAE